MQIITTLTVSQRNHIKSSKEDQNNQKEVLVQLLTNLENSKYRIHTLFGRVVYDIKKREIIDCGEPGEQMPVTIDLVETVINAGTKLILIDTKEKKVIFFDSFFIATAFCNGQNVRPLTLDVVLSNYDELIKSKNKILLNQLYKESFNIE